MMRAPIRQSVGALVLGASLAVARRHQHFAQASAERVRFARVEGIVTLRPPASGVHVDRASVLQDERDLPGEAVNVLSETLVRSRLLRVIQPREVVAKLAHRYRITAVTR